MRRVRSGDYVVDPHAVADAIVRQATRGRGADARPSQVLVAIELDRATVQAQKRHAGPGVDPA